jgi:hypothetical protein
MHQIRQPWMYNGQDRLQQRYSTCHFAASVQDDKFNIRPQVAQPATSCILADIVYPWPFGTDQDLHHWITDPDPALFVSGFQDDNKN